MYSISASIWRGRRPDCTGRRAAGYLFFGDGAVQRGSKVIYDRSQSAIATIERGIMDWERVFDGADWFHWTGITPAISAGTADVCLEAAQAAKRLGLTVSWTSTTARTCGSGAKKPARLCLNWSASAILPSAMRRTRTRFLGSKRPKLMLPAARLRPISIVMLRPPG